MEHRMYIAGEWVDSESGERLEATSPATGESLGSVPAGTREVTGQGAVVGDEIAGSVDTHAVGFVGSITTGYKVAERAAGKALLPEMGGNGPVVVLEDADLDKAVAATLVASFLCAGQSCTAGERFLVHESVHDAYLDKLAAAMAQ